MLVVFGVGDVLGGVLADPAITVTLAGQSPADIQAAEPTAYRLYDFVTRSGGANLVLIGLLLAAIVAIPYRGGQRWAWWAMWILPAWAALVPVQFLVVGVAAGQPPAPPMVSGPIVAAIAAAVLLLDRQRFSAPEGFRCGCWRDEVDRLAPPVRARLRVAVGVEFGDDGPVVDVTSLRVVIDRTDFGEEVLGLHDRDVDRRRQAFVRDEDEAVVALELDGDGLDEGIVVVRVLDAAANRLDELEELVGFHLALAGEDHIGVDLLVALVEFVEVHVGTAGGGSGNGRPVYAATSGSRGLSAPRRAISPRPIRVAGASVARSRTAR